MGGEAAGAIIAVLTHRISDCVPRAHIGRTNRSNTEFGFDAIDMVEAERTLFELQRAMEAPIQFGDRNLNLDVSIGFAARGLDDSDVEAVVERAEHALAKARASHAKVACFTEEDGRARQRRLALMRDLRTAVGKSELFVVYQPKLRVRTGVIDAVEALVRWRHPERGMVSPDDFISLAEEGEEIRPITEFVITEAVKDRETLSSAGMPLFINVNISAQLLADESFVTWAIAAVAGAPHNFGFEITETAVINNPEKALASIEKFAAHGIKIAIDDYGSGLSSLSYLKQIPAQELKIDKAFVSGLTTSHRDPLLVRSTIDLAHALEMEVTAEGVDNAMSLALLQVMGCDSIQGYHVSKPLVLDDLLRFMAEFEAKSLERSPSIAARA